MSIIWYNKHMDIKLNISENLIKLAKGLSSPLYVVGGYVRDSIIG